jgi:D-serine deaminase-like pyridoxal phosphate-dependent protein
MTVVVPDARDAAVRYDRYRRALGTRRFPAALVDLDALEHNVDALVAGVRAAGKHLRVASKSVRCVALIQRILARGGATTRGVMAFAAPEAALLVEHGLRDILIAYPTVQPADTRLIAELNRAPGTTVSVAVDAPEHLDALDAAAAAVGTTVPVIVDADVSLRLFRGRVHIGARRSPLHDAAAVVALAERAAARKHLRFHGVMAYEAHIAGVPDASPFNRWSNGPTRAMKQLARPRVAATRRAIADELAARGLTPTVFNGGGTASLASAAGESVLTEVTAGSGFLDSHLFDYYRGLRLAPACCFALQVVRRPAADLVTCNGGGFVASGAPGPDRLPRPFLPAGLELLSLEGAGEVQTPLRVPPGVDLALGAPVFFRHAKAGELAEHVERYVLVRGDRVEDEVPTYRGMGRCVL